MKSDKIKRRREKKIDQIVRNLNKEDVVKLDRLAAEKNISREEYLRRIIHGHVLSSELREVESKYESLVNVIADAIENQSEKIEMLTRTIRGLQEEGKKND